MAKLGYRALRLAWRRLGLGGDDRSRRPPSRQADRAPRQHARSAHRCRRRSRPRSASGGRACSTIAIASGAMSISSGRSPRPRRSRSPIRRSASPPGSSRSGGAGATSRTRPGAASSRGATRTTSSSRRSCSTGSRARSVPRCACTTRPSRAGVRFRSRRGSRCRSGSRHSRRRIGCRGRLAEPYYNIVRWEVIDEGGHFPGLENPKRLAHEISEFFRSLED